MHRNERKSVAMKAGNDGGPHGKTFMFVVERRRSTGVRSKRQVS